MRAWVLAARPPTLPAAIVPVLVGTAAAAQLEAIRWLPFVATLLAAIFIQIGTNLANDYFDFRKGADTADRLGPSRVTQAGLIAPETVWRGALASFGVASILGLYLIVVGGWPILVIGVLSVLAGIAYTGGPWPLGYHGLGDLFVFVFFGLVAVGGSAYLQAGEIPVQAWLAALPVGFLVTAILVVNNLRDIATDRVAGKRTLAVRIGGARTRAQYALLVLGAYLVAGLSQTWLPLLSLPLAIALVRAVGRDTGAALNLSLKQTGQLHLIFGILLALSLWL